MRKGILHFRSLRIASAFWALTILGLFGLTGCISPPPGEPTDSQNLIFTQAAQTISAQLTQVIVPATLTPEEASPAAQTEIAPVETGSPSEPQEPASSPTPDRSAVLTQIALPTPTQTTAAESEAPAATEPAATQDPDAGGGQATATDTPLALGTSVPEETAAPETAPAPTEAFDLIFEDDFSLQTGWPVQREADWSLRYGRSGYLITVDTRNDAIWSVRSQDYEDISLEVDAVRVSGPNNGYFGLICRHVNGGNFYALVVTSEGNYAILKQKNGQIEYLMESAEPNAAIATGFTPNRLRGDCIGNTLSLTVNDQKLAEVQDSDFTSGAAGLVAGTRNLEGLEALFDNFAVRRP